MTASPPGSPGRARFRRLIRALEVLLGTAALVGAGFVLASQNETTSTKKKQLGAAGDARVVRVATVTRVGVDRPHRYSSVVRAGRRAVLAFTVGGRLSRRPVQVGDRVTAGQVLARVERRRFAHALHGANARVRDLSARLAQARRDLARAKILVRTQTIPTVRLEQAESQVASLQALQNAARVGAAEAWRSFGEATLRAPFAGTITEVRLEPGEIAAPGRPIIFLSGDGPPEVEVEVPESLSADLRPGQAVRIDLPLIGRRALVGRIRYVGSTARGMGRLFPLIVTIEDRGVARPGMTATVTVTSPARPALTVPLAAVINPSGRSPSVYRIVGARARRVPVRTGALIGARVVVTQGLALGDRVAVSGHAELLDGDRVGVRR